MLRPGFRMPALFWAGILFYAPLVCFDLAAVTTMLSAKQDIQRSLTGFDN
jgi:hypothetical protein